MSWLNFLPGVFGGAKDLKESFWESAEKKGVRKHLEGMADIDRDVSVLNQFSSEFHERNKRTWWDSFVDGLNRLPSDDINTKLFHSCSSGAAEIP